MRLLSKQAVGYTLSALVMASVAFAPGQALATEEDKRLYLSATQSAIGTPLAETITVEKLSPTTDVNAAVKPFIALEAVKVQVTTTTPDSGTGKHVLFKQTFTPEPVLYGKKASSIRLERIIATPDIMPFGTYTVGASSSKPSSLEVGEFSVAVSSVGDDADLMTDNDRFEQGKSYTVYYNIVNVITPGGILLTAPDINTAANIVTSEIRITYNNSTIVEPLAPYAEQSDKVTDFKIDEFKPVALTNNNPSAPALTDGLNDYLLAALPMTHVGTDPDSTDPGVAVDEKFYVFKQPFTMPIELAGRLLGTGGMAATDTINILFQAYNGEGFGESDFYKLDSAATTANYEVADAWLTKSGSPVKLEPTELLANIEYDLYYVVKNTDDKTEFDYSESATAVKNSTRIIFKDSPLPIEDMYLAPATHQSFWGTGDAEAPVFADLKLFEELSESVATPAATFIVPALEIPFNVGYSADKAIFLEITNVAIAAEQLVTLKQTFKATPQMHGLTLGNDVIDVQRIIADNEVESLFLVPTAVNIVGTALDTAIRGLKDSQYLVTRFTGENETVVAYDTTDASASTPLRNGIIYTVYYAAKANVTGTISDGTRIVVMGEIVTPEGPIAETPAPSLEAADRMVPKAQKYEGVADITQENVADFTEMTEAQFVADETARSLSYPDALEANETVAKIVRFALTGITPNQPQVLNLTFTYEGADAVANDSTLVFEKLIDGAGAAMPYALVPAKPAVDEADGKFWFVDTTTGASLPSPVQLTSGTSYTIAFAIMDRAATDDGYDASTSFDRDSAAGDISDPARIVIRSADTPPPTPGSDSSSGGCTVGSNPATDLMLLLLTLMGMVGLRSIATRKQD